MSEPELRQIVLTICQPCIDGEGSECHTPGCALWMHRVDLPIRTYEELEQCGWRWKETTFGSWVVHHYKREDYDTLTPPTPVYRLVPAGEGE